MIRGPVSFTGGPGGQDETQVSLASQTATGPTAGWLSVKARRTTILAAHAMTKPKSEQQKQFKAAAATLVVAVLGLATAVVSGLALLPRVRLVEVLTVVAGGIGGGAALTAALVQFKQAREAQRHSR